MRSTKNKKNSSSLPELHVRLINEDHEELKNIASNEGISKAEAARRIIHTAIATDAAENGLDVITLALRKTIRAELDGKFKEIKDLEYKALSTSATVQFLLLRSLKYIMTDLNESEFRAIYEAARRDAFNFVYRNGKAPDVEFDFMESDEGFASSSKNADVDYASILSKGFKLDE